MCYVTHLIELWQHLQFQLCYRCNVITKYYRFCFPFPFVSPARRITCIIIVISSIIISSTSLLIPDHRYDHICFFVFVVLNSFLRNMKMCLSLTYFVFTEMAQVVVDNDQKQYHGCWCPGDVKGENNGNHGYTHQCCCYSRRSGNASIDILWNSRWVFTPLIITHLIEDVKWHLSYVALLWIRNIEMYLQLISFLHTVLSQVVQILPHVSFLMWDRNLPIRQSQYYGCWCPGDVRSQGVSAHNINC